jgi:3-oxoacyl-[acyl-carrier-protein] synthase I
MSLWNIFTQATAPAPSAGPAIRLGIQAAGLCCPVGYHLQAASCALRAHMDHFQESEFITQQGDALLVARLPETELWGQARLARWLELAIADCLQHTPKIDTRQVPLIWLAPESERTGADLEWYGQVFDQAVAQLGLAFHASSGVLVQGRAGLAGALAQAARLLAKPEHPYVLLAGVDSYLDAGTINHYLQAQRLQTPGNSDGFIPGEAAAAVLLHAVQSGHSGLHISGYGQAQEEGRPDGSVPSRAQGLSQALRDALSAGGQSYSDLQFRISDQNGEAFFAREASNALTRVAPVGGHKLPLLSLADCIGEVGAATGPAVLAYLAQHMPRSSSPGHCGVLHLANDNGLRCAAVLHYQPS